MDNDDKTNNETPVGSGKEEGVDSNPKPANRGPLPDVSPKREDGSPEPGNREVGAVRKNDAPKQPRPSEDKYIARKAAGGILVILGFALLVLR